MAGSGFEYQLVEPIYEVTEGSPTAIEALRRELDDLGAKGFRFVGTVPLGEFSRGGNGVIAESEPVTMIVMCRERTEEPGD